MITKRWLILALCIAFIVLQVAYNLCFVERVPSTTGTTHIRVVHDDSTPWFLLALLFGFFILGCGVGILWAGRWCWRGIRRLPVRLLCTFALILLGGSGVLFGLVCMFGVPASENVWVDFESQAVVKRQTRLFPVPNFDERLAFSDIDYIRYDFKKAADDDDGGGTVFLIKTNGAEFELYYAVSEEEGRHLSQELARLMEKPLEEVNLSH